MLNHVVSPIGGQIASFLLELHNCWGCMSSVVSAEMTTEWSESGHRVKQVIAFNRKI